MPLDFVAIDVETANADLSSICQVGVSSFQNGKPNDQWKSLVNPEDDFDDINVSIHGIDERTVRFAPNWAKVYPSVTLRLNGKIVVSHTAFDRLALYRACEKNKLPLCECQWLDSAKVVRRAWPKFAKSGFSLANVAQELGINYVPHDALEDARCAGEILLRAMTESGLGLDQWLNRVKQQINLAHIGPITREGNPDGPLYGEVLVFTGALSLPRREAADLASTTGCEVAVGVNKRTTLLVVGDQDINRLAGYEKSSKQRKAEELMKMGQRIRILAESDFRRIVKL
jgi:DNA polymerase III subunit epsilon